MLTYFILMSTLPGGYDQKTAKECMSFFLLGHARLSHAGLLRILGSFSSPRICSTFAPFEVPELILSPGL
jgi:hypothetical protein